MIKCDLSCDFCLEFADVKEHLDRKISDFRDEFVLLATLGCFREGYCLYMPTTHKRSFASLGESALLSIEIDLEYLRQKIAREYSTSVILAEHGPGINDSGASCCDHAHMHLIPVNDSRQVFFEFYKTSSDVQVFDNLSELAKFPEEPYIYLSCAPGQHFVWKNAESFGRQFVRRICAELDGLGPMFNWRMHQFPENIQRTTERMRKRLEVENIAA